MAANPFVADRERLDGSDRLASVVATLPSELRRTNAVPLVGIVRELEASSVIEIGVIHAVTRVRVADADAVTTQRRILEDYRDRRLYDRDRTHCSNIKRIATQIRTADGSLRHSPETAPLDQVLAPLEDADDDLLGDIERILDASIEAIVEIDESALVEDARAAQERFAERMRPTIEDIKRNIGRMNELAGKLIADM
jgi:hypothetical protein